MSRFLESICLEREGFRLLSYHQRRVNETFAHFYPDTPPLDLARLLNPVPRVEGRTKCRVVYDRDVAHIFYESYRLPEIDRVIFIEADVAYPYKFLDREALTRYASLVQEKEMVVFVRGGMVTDSLVSNVVFRDEKGWVTPRTYLLNGVKRQYYLDQGAIRQEDIPLGEVFRFSQVGLINAMIDLGELVLPIERVEVRHGLENL